MSIYQNRDDGNSNLSEAMEQSKHDLNAFVPIYEAYVERIYAYCYHRVQSSQDAEDLTSQVFARAMAHSRTYRGGSVGAWLFQIAYHLTIDYFRAKKPIPISEDVLNNISDHNQLLPLEILIHKERLALLHQWLDNLAEDKRNLLLLRITGDLSAVEIGVIVGKSAGTIRVEIHRIIQQLKQYALEDQ